MTRCEVFELHESLMQLQSGGLLLAKLSFGLEPWNRLAGFFEAYVF